MRDVLLLNDTLTRTKRQAYRARNLAMSLLVVVPAAP